MKTIDIWNIKINPLSKVEIVDLIDEHISNNSGTFQLTGVNPETIVQAQLINGLKTSINTSEIVSIDNMLVLTFLRLLGHRINERAACPDVFELLLERASQKGFTVYFLGAREDILLNMKERLKIKYPELKIIGSQHGYYNCTEELAIVQEIEKLHPDMLFIALPTPQKEMFIHEYKERKIARFAFGIGGAFDCQAGKVVRAPRWMRSIGLEGIHRALQNPSDYGKRYVKYNLTFISLFISVLLNKKKVSSSGE
jgi:N-acetylglucosaminyldiphosphoundecaprenol N-acetyl-beta-D-mannosaminyltransferase